MVAPMPGARGQPRLELVLAARRVGQPARRCGAASMLLGGTSHAGAADWRCWDCLRALRRSAGELASVLLDASFLTLPVPHFSHAACFLLISRRVPVLSVGDDFRLPPKTAWLLRCAPVFRTGCSGLRGLLLRTPTARSVHHTSATQRLCWQKLSSCFSGFTGDFARPPYARRGSAEDWIARMAESPFARSRVLRGADRRRPSHSSVTTAHESARRRRRAPVDAPRPVSERKPRSRVSRVSALGADHRNRQRATNVGVEEAHLRPPGGRQWQPPT